MDEEDELGQEISAEDRTGTGDIPDSQEDGTSLLGKLKKSVKKSKNEGRGGKNSPASKKKGSRVLQLAIVAGLAIFILADYIVPPDQPTSNSTPAPTDQDSNGSPSPEVNVEPSPEVNVEPSPEVNVGPSPEVNVEPSEVNVEPSPEVNVEPSPEVNVEPSPEVNVEPSLEANPAPSTDEGGQAAGETISTEDLFKDVLEGKDQNTLDQDSSSLGSENDLNVGEGASDLNSSASDEDSLTEKILQDLEGQAKKATIPTQKTEYVPPPDYEYHGRGLVYNCKGKHWACVDGPSYKICEENASSLKYLKRSPECYPFNVYESVKGCESMQNRMVTSSATTDFCGE